MTKITAAVVRSAGGAFALEEVDLADPRPEELLVRVVATGICHADLIARDQRFPIPLPAVFGHEGAAVVEAVGEAVADFEVGDHVLMHFGFCNACRSCRAGRPAYCLEGFRYQFGGARPDGSSAYTQDGRRINGHFFGQSSFATHSVVHRRNAVKIDPDAPLELLGPLGCGVQTGFGAIVNSLRVPAGSSVVIFGAGAVGLSAVMGAKACGVRRIVAVDVNPERLALALELGATDVIDARSEPDVAAAAREACGGEVEFALETSGRVEVARQAVDALAVGGTAGMVGVTSIESEVTFHQQSLVHGQTITGILSGDSVPSQFLPRLVDFHRRGMLPLEKIVQTVPFADIEQAAHASEAGEIVKAVLTMP